jgi:hypothetical protein
VIAPAPAEYVPETATDDDDSWNRQTEPPVVTFASRKDSDGNVLMWNSSHRRRCSGPNRKELKGGRNRGRHNDARVPRETTEVDRGGFAGERVQEDVRIVVNGRRATEKLPNDDDRRPV